MTPSDDEGPTGPMGSGTSPSSDMENLAWRARDKFTQVVRGRSLRGVGTYAVLAIQSDAPDRLSDQSE